MENQRIEGIRHQVEGTFEKTLGKLIGDAKLTSDGAAEWALGDAQNSACAQGGQSVAAVYRDRITGVAHRFKGAIEQGLGNLIGDCRPSWLPTCK
jgi:uncharacterized protein YjbJ (UPF0337 family)